MSSMFPSSQQCVFPFSCLIVVVFSGYLHSREPPSPRPALPRPLWDEVQTAVLLTRLRTVGTRSLRNNQAFSGELKYCLFVHV